MYPHFMGRVVMGTHFKVFEFHLEGKKKMRNLGTVQVPTEAFMAVLKLDSD